MELVDLALLLGAAVLFVGLFFGTLSMRFGIPSLLVFLLVGMAAGENGFGGIRFDNLQTSYLVSNLALAIILLDGGLRTRLTTFRVGLKPALSLATLGVAISCALVGIFATWLLNIDWRIGLLLGAIVGSTDAAAVFSVLRGAGIHLNERVSSTLEIESGLNDPMAIFLTITLIDILTHPGMQFSMGTLVSLIRDFGIGAGLGLGLGALLATLIRRLHSNEGLHALLLCAGGTIIFATTNLVEGSGFLAVYLTGLYVGNHRGGISDNVLRNMDAFGWLAQSCMFLLLGLLVSPQGLLEIAPWAVLIALFLMFIARPVSVMLSLPPLSFSWTERLFISWTGLRGAVPIVLAMFPLLAGVDHAHQLFSIAFVVVLASLLVQGMSMRWFASLLRVDLPTLPEPLQVTAFAGSQNLYMMQFNVEPGARACGLSTNRLASERVQPLVLTRGGEHLSLQDDIKVEEGDHITWLAPITAKPLLADLCQTITPSIKRFYGDFTVLGDALVSDLAAAYGLASLPEDEHHLTLDALFRRHVGKHPVVGDIVYLGKLRLRVRSLEDGRVQQVGIRLPQ
jgi:cell volume regulation protein A